MARPLALTTVFANLTGTQPISLLDGDLAQIVAAVNDPLSYSNYALDTGAVNALVATFNPAVTTLAAGLALYVKVLNTNTGASTLNANGTGAKSVVHADGTAVASGDLVAGTVATVIYDGTNYVLTSAAGSTFATLTITGHLVFSGTGTVTVPLPLTGAAAVSTPSSGVADLAALATDGFSAAHSAAYFLNDAGTRWEFGGGATARNLAGIGLDITSAYISTTGTAGSGAGVKSITLKANSVNALVRGVEIYCLFGTANTPTVSLNINGVGSVLQVVGVNTAKYVLAATLWYATSTTGIFYGTITRVDTPSLAASGQNIGIGSLAFGSDMTITIDSTAATATVYILQVRQIG